MPARKNDPAKVTLPSDREILITRTFDAPRRFIFEALSKCEHVKHWWGPRGFVITDCQLDFRPGGKWRYVVRKPDGAEEAFRGEIREIVPNERVVQTFEYEPMPGFVSVETLTLVEQNGKTIYTVRSLFNSVEERDGMLQSGMEGGMNETLDRLEEYLPELQGAAVH
ncbi:MAG TPA: SRPBCC family protein [Gemmatimonadaceae bacterium]|nr:SRPBCC family protein [Gemmatimonadaceae bacterium]